jgi:hypothetical protein
MSKKQLGHAKISIARLAEEIFSFRGLPMSYKNIQDDPMLIIHEAIAARQEFDELKRFKAEMLDFKDAVRELIRYCEDHNWGIIPEPGVTLDRVEFFLAAQNDETCGCLLDPYDCAYSRDNEGPCKCKCHKHRSPDITPLVRIEA